MVFFPEPLQPTTVPCTVGRFLPCRQSSGSNGRGIKVLFISVFVAHLAVPCCPLPTFLAFIPLRDLLSSKFTITKNAMKAMTSKPIKIICFSLKISPPIHKNMLSSVFKRKVSLLSSRYCTVRQRVSHQPNSIQGSGSQTMSSDSICSATGSDKVSSIDNLTALSAS